MGQKQDNLIVVLDIGSAWTRVLAADVNENVLRYRGHGVAQSAGMRKGLIAELAPAAKAVRAANEQAERVARANIDECVVGIGGPHIRGVNTNGGFQLSRGMREITGEDVRAAIGRARAIELPADREILHLLPRQFILDEQPGIFDPVGMVGARLEVELHIATCGGGALQSTVTCANRAGLEVSEAVLESLAAAECTLSADERELGVCVLDIGAHSTDLAVFFEGAVAYTASVAIGGAHFTNDLAIGLQLPLAQAEELKRQYGNAVVTAVPQLAEVEITNSARRTRNAPAADHGGDSGAARARAHVLRERKPALWRRGGCAGRGLRSDRRRLHVARHARCCREPVARAGTRRLTRAAVAHAAGSESSSLGREHRNGSLRASHSNHARSRRQQQQFAR